jgi:CubicO group peptidase (beta-lactamase class C family)
MFLKAIGVAFFVGQGVVGGINAADVQAATPDACRAPAVLTDFALQASIDPLIDAAVKKGFAGQVAIIKDGTLVYARSTGSADLAGTVGLTSATLHHVASITKEVTAALAVKAAEEGRIDLAAPVAPYVPDTIFARRDITFADLLAHKSGLQSTYAAEDTGNAERALNALDKAAKDFSDAGSFSYGNDNYDLLGIVLERVYGEKFEELVRAKLFEPACLERFGFWGETDVGDPTLVAQPTSGFPKNLRRRNYGMVSSAGLLITAVDLVRWRVALRSGAVLTSTSYETMTTPRAPMRLGEATYGAFLIAHPSLGRVWSGRGFEDWGDNAIVNDYLDCGVVLAVATSRGPLKETGLPPFRDSLSAEIEKALSSGICGVRAEK